MPHTWPVGSLNRMVVGRPIE